MKRQLLGALLITLTVGSLLLVACQPTEQPPIKIGVQGPMTGDWTYEGEGFRRAVQLLADQINEQGGLLDGRQVEIIVGDDRGDRDEARRVAEHLAAAGVVAVVGSYNSDATEASAAVYDAAGIVQITPSSTAIRLTEKGYSRFFRICSRNDFQAQLAAELMINTLGKERVALIHDGSLYAQGLAEAAQHVVEELGGETVLFTAITPGQRDFTPLLEELREHDVEAIYFTGYWMEGALLARQMYEAGLRKIQLIGGDAMDNPEFVQYAGTEAAAGALVTTEMLARDMHYPATEKFIADYEQAYGEFPESNRTLGAADAFRLIANAIEQTDSADPALLAKYLHDDLHDFPGITGTIAGYDENGDRLGATYVAYIVDESGNFVLYQPE